MARSVMEHSFSQVPRADIPRSSFNRSHGVKTTFDADYLVPILVDDIVPGDTFRVNCNFVVNLTSPTVVNLQDNLFVDTFFFFVPYRLVWDNWTKFCGEQVDPGDSIDYTIPIIQQNSSWSLGLADDNDNGGPLADYMGIPVGRLIADAAVPDDNTISALPFRAYNLIWNDWFRDENLQDSLTVQTDNGADWIHGGASNYELRKRGKRHDYFTSCLPWPQKGTAIDLPLGTTAPLQTTGDGEPTFDFDAVSATKLQSMITTANVETVATGTSTDTLGWNDPKLEVDLSTATSATINDLRLAFQTQRLLERDARSGTRYNETILAHFGVTVPDFRLQRPEFLGGGSSRVQLTKIAQTTYQGTQTVEDAKGSLSSIGQASGTHSFTSSFTEHGVIIGLINARADITYSQGIERYWGKQTRYDFYYPVLAQIGEQSVTNVEIFAQGTAADDTVFGYQERYAELRYKPSRLTGLMAVDTASNLDEFHLSEDFASLPTLGNAFIKSNTGAPLDRAISVPSQPHFIADIYFDMKCARPMPIYGVPGNLDHF